MAGTGSVGSKTEEIISVPRSMHTVLYVMHWLNHIAEYRLSASDLSTVYTLLWTVCRTTACTAVNCMLWNVCCTADDFSSSWFISPGWCKGNLCIKSTTIYNLPHQQISRALVTENVFVGPVPCFWWKELKWQVHFTMDTLSLTLGTEKYIGLFLI